MGINSTIAYVDGYNIYHGIIDKRNIVPSGYTEYSANRPWGNLLWLNLESFIESYRLPSTKLSKIKFFEAPSYKPDSLRRQQIYKNALLSLNTMDQGSFFGGEFKSNIVRCSHCGRSHTHHIEKRTDVTIAVELLSDFYKKNCDSAIIISGDTDLLPAIDKIIKDDVDFKVYMILPPHRRPQALRNLVGESKCKRIRYNRLVNNQFPNTLTVNGFQINNPI